MFLRACATVLALASGVLSAERAAAQPEGLARLVELMGLPEIVQVMREEGLDYGATLAEEMLPAGASGQWERTVSRIYDPDRMAATVRDGFVAAMEGVDPGPLIAFFDTEAGQRLVALEVSARRAMMDEDVEAAAREDYLARAADPDETFRLVRDFVQANDLVEANVVGALNSNFAFYRGLADGGALEMTEGEMLADVWAQEEETRADTREWLYGFLLMAYDPVSAEVLQRYVTLSETEAGRAMNRALFAGFDRMYAEISYALGLAIAREMQATEL
jgi:hypothetical protein